MSYYLLSNAYLIQNNYLTPDRRSVKNIPESYNTDKNILTMQLMGGLGNQLFQIFTLISTAIDNKYKFIIPYNKVDSHSANRDSRPTYWDTIFSQITKYTKKEINYDEVLKENSFNFEKIDLSKFNNKNIKLIGYFQSYKYFIKNYEYIVNLLDLYKKQTEIKEKYIKENLTNNINIFLHFRIGDYASTSAHPVQTIDYYIIALNTMIQLLSRDNFNLIYFYEEKDITQVNENINKLSNGFPELTFISRPKNMEDYEEMLLMSCCDHAIIANSSFSWWAAYLIQNKNKKIIYPNKWFSGNIEHYNIDDLCPENWIRVDD